MAWDLSITPEGDLAFGPNNDLLGISDPLLAGQRIRVRLKIQRGWALDVTGMLGSRILNVKGGASADVIEAQIRDALSPMEDVSIEGIQIDMSDPRQPLVTVGYSPRSPLVGPMRVAPLSYVIEVPLTVGD